MGDVTNITPPARPGRSVKGTPPEELFNDIMHVIEAAESKPDFGALNSIAVLLSVASAQARGYAAEADKHKEADFIMRAYLRHTLDRAITSFPDVMRTEGCAVCDK